MRSTLLAGALACLVLVSIAGAADRPVPLRYHVEGTTIVFGHDATDADLAVLDLHPELTAVSIPGAQVWSGPDPRTVPLPITNTGFAHLARCTKLEKLYLSGMQPLRVTDDGLKSLAGLVHLKVFDAGATPFTDAGIAHLAPLVNMEELPLDFNTRVSDASMPTIAKMTKLRVLRFHGARGVTDAGITAIRDLRELENLQLGYASLTDAGMATIARFANLKTLDLQNTQITDVGMSHLEGLKKLTWIALRGDRKVTSAGLRHVADKTDLEWLIADGTAVDDAGLAHLRRLTKLESVYLDDTGVTDEGLPPLLGLQRLKHLHLSGTRVTDEGIQQLAALKALEYIELDRTAVTEAGFARLAAHFPNLKWTNRVTTKRPAA
jgi:hypothetical protein